MGPGAGNTCYVHKIPGSSVASTSNNGDGTVYGTINFGAENFSTLRETMTHEIGHTFNLSNCGTCGHRTSIMGPLIYSGFSEVTTCDNQGVRATYCPTPTPTPTPAPGACGTRPDSNGNCLPGYTNNGCNGCCSDAARDACRNSGWYFNSVDGDCRPLSDICFEQQYECTVYGQFWNEFACGCTPPARPRRCWWT